MEPVPVAGRLHPHGLHELGAATGHPSRPNCPTLVEHGGFGTETYAREGLRAEIAAMMTGEQLGVGHEPRHGTPYVISWIKALENNPKGDPRRGRRHAADFGLTDLPGARAEPGRGAGGARAPGRRRRPEAGGRSGTAAAGGSGAGAPAPAHEGAMRVPGRTAETISAAPAGGADGSAAPAMSDDLKTVLGTGALRDTGWDARRR